MANLEQYPDLSKWLDDVTFDSNDIEWQQYVVGAEEVQSKLIELGSEIDSLKAQLDKYNTPL